jgi:hypothetical protein
MSNMEVSQHIISYCNEIAIFEGRGQSDLLTHLTSVRRDLEVSNILDGTQHSKLNYRIGKIPRA